MGNAFLDPAGSYGFRPQLRPRPKSNDWGGVNPTDPGEPRDEFLVPVGTRFIWDICSLQTGIHRPIAGRYRKLLTPLHMPDPEVPPGDDPSEYKELTTSLVWLDAFDGHPAALRELVISGPIALIAMANYYRQLGFHAEIQRGELGVMEIRPCSTYRNGFGQFGPPVIETRGFTPRDFDLFGPILTPPPSPILGGPAPKPQLTPPDDKAHPGSAHPAFAPEPEPEPVREDPLARFKPVGASKKPF
jgi:hypothetical protein